MDVDLDLLTTARGLFETVDFELPFTQFLDDGWSSLYNNHTGQARAVLLYEPDGIVFKSVINYSWYNSEVVQTEAINSAELTADVCGRVRNIRAAGSDMYDDILIQEYIEGNMCACQPFASWSGCCAAINNSVSKVLPGRYVDVHIGNWLVEYDTGDVILFDW